MTFQQTLVPAGQLKAEICLLLLQSLKQPRRNHFWTFNIASPDCMHIKFFKKVHSISPAPACPSKGTHPSCAWSIPPMSAPKPRWGRAAGTSPLPQKPRETSNVVKPCKTHKQTIRSFTNKNVYRWVTYIFNIFWATCLHDLIARPAPPPGHHLASHYFPDLLSHGAKGILWQTRGLDRKPKYPNTGRTSVEKTLQSRVPLME